MTSLFIDFRSDDAHCSGMAIGPSYQIACEHLVSGGSYPLFVEITKFEDTLIANIAVNRQQLWDFLCGLPP